MGRRAKYPSPEKGAQDWFKYWMMFTEHALKGIPIPKELIKIAEAIEEELAQK